MRVVEEDRQRVRRQVRQVVGGELLQRGDQRFAAAGGLGREAVRLELVPAGEDVDEDRQDQLHRGEEQAEEEQAGVDRRLADVEGREQPLLAEEERQDPEHRAEVADGERHPLPDVPPLVVADLVGHDRDQLRDGVLLDQRVEQPDALVPAEPGEEGVGLGRAAGAVDHEEAAERKAGLAGAVQDGVVQVAAVERGEGVEERHDPARRDELDGQQERRGGDPAPEPGRRPRPLEEREDDGQQQAAEQGGQRQALQRVGGEGGRGGAVEAVARLDDEGGVRPERQAEQDRGQPERADVEQPRRHRAVPEPAQRRVEPREAAGEPEDEDDGQVERAADQPVAGPGRRVAPRLGVLLLVEHAGELGRQGRAERAHVQRARHHAEQVLPDERGEDDDGERVHGRPRLPDRRGRSG